MLDTDSFDSAVGPYVDGGLGGGVGANDAMTLNGAVGVGGSLWTASTSTLDLNGVSGVGLELHADGPLQANGVFDIGSNAFVNGDVTAYGVMTIGGALYVPSSATVGTLVSSKGTIVGPVTVPDPCDCAANQLIDVAAIVASGQASNDDTIIGLDPNVFVNGTGALRLDLPCGRYYLGGDHLRWHRDNRRPRPRRAVRGRGHRPERRPGDHDRPPGHARPLRRWQPGIQRRRLVRIDARTSPVAHLRGRQPGPVQR